MRYELNIEPEPFETFPEFDEESETLDTELANWEWEEEAGRRRRPRRPAVPRARPGGRVVSTKRKRLIKSPFRPPIRPPRPPIRPPRPVIFPIFPLPPVSVVEPRPPQPPAPAGAEPTGAAPAPAGGSPTPPSAEPSAEGSEYVRWVQSALNDVLGLRLPVDGIMGPEVRSAVRSFQERQGLPITGLVGPDTERALIAARSGADATKPAEPGMTEPPTSATPPPAAEFDFEWEVAPLGQRETQRFTYSGQIVRFPSGEILRVVTGLPIGKHEDYWDPTGSGTPLLDTGPAHKDKKLSTSFTVRELTTSGGVSADIARIDPKLVECLQRLRDHVGKGVKITSGFRSWKRNRDIYEKRGKTPTLSQHCAGRAADIRIAGMNGLEIGKAAIDACGPNIGVGLANTFAHIDVRGFAAAWNYGGVKDSWVAEIKRYQKEKGGSSRKPSTAGAKLRPDAAKPLADALVRRTVPAPTAPVPKRHRQEGARVARRLR